MSDLRRENFVVPLFLGNVFATDFAQGAARVALSWIVLQQHGAASLSLIVLVMALGQFSGAFIAGHFTDRFSRRTIAALTNWISSAGLFGIAVVLFRGNAQVYYIAPLTFATYLALAVHDNAARTLIPEIVPPGNLRRVNGLFVTLGEVGYFIAPLAAGWIIEGLGGGAALCLTASACVVAAVLVRIIPLRDRAEVSAAVEVAPPPRLKLAFFLQNQWLLTGLCAAVSANLFILPISNLLIPIRVSEVGFGAAELGYFYAALSAGFASAGLARMPRFSSVAESVQLALYISGAALIYVLTYFFDFLPVIFVCGFFAGSLLVVFEVNWNAIMQERTPSSLVGRVYGVSSWLSFVGRSVGVALAGWAVGGLGTQFVISACIVGLLITLGVALLAGRLLLLERRAGDETSANI